jgi:hypothetical protein
MTIDQISGGRLELGIGAGGTGFDAAVLGAEPSAAAERAARFEEFVVAMDVLLREPATSFAGRYFTAIESRTFPGCTQQPRVPFTIGAAGPRGLGLAARFGAAWVTYGPMAPRPTRDEWFAGVSKQLAGLDAACRAVVREPDSINRMALVGLELSWAQESIGAWDDFCGRIEGPLAATGGPGVTGSSACGVRRDLPPDQVVRPNAANRYQLDLQPACDMRIRLPGLWCRALYYG